MSELSATASIEIRSSAEEVWDALTNPVQIKKYFFGTDAKSEWRVGSPITFTGEWEGKQYEDHGTILQFEKDKLMRYNYWSSNSGKPDVPGNYANVTYELSQNGDKTRLTITQDNVGSEDGKKHSEQNWNMVLENLKKLLEE